MSYEPETPLDGTDLSEEATTSFDPRDPIEVTDASGADDNPGTDDNPITVPTKRQLGEDREHSAPPTGE